MLEGMVCRLCGSVSWSLMNCCQDGSQGDCHLDIRLTWRIYLEDCSLTWLLG